MDFVEKNATIFAKLILYLDNKSLSIVIRDAQDNERKAFIKGTLFVKRKTESYFPLYRANIF